MSFCNVTVFLLSVSQIIADFFLYRQYIYNLFTKSSLLFTNQINSIKNKHLYKNVNDNYSISISIYGTYCI